jgi:hypothetical protein
MSGAQVIVVYPRKDGATFNKESYAVTELTGDGPYSYSVVMEFESPEGFGAAAADENTKEIMADVPNFSSEQPTILHGAVIGREKA